MLSEENNHLSNAAVAQDKIGSTTTDDDDDGTSAAAASLRQRSRTHFGRERSLSVPCSSAGSDVETVVTKAKRASSFLWMLLHSQVGLTRTRTAFSAII